MFDSLSNNFQALLLRYTWIQALAGILPLSALIDFIDVPQKLHNLQLNDTCPLWSWPITPVAARLLLRPKEGSLRCFLDKTGQSPALLAMDGRYGDEYVVSNPETIRMCMRTQTPRKIVNEHINMNMSNPRLQNLDIVHVTRAKTVNKADGTRSHGGFLTLLHSTLIVYCLISVLGWTLLLGLIVATAILECYVAMAFFCLMPCSGLVIAFMHRTAPMRLLETDDSNPFTRIVIVAEHWNSSDWTVFYGQSTIINSLLNRPLEPTGKGLSDMQSMAARAILQALILGQWALVLGSAATQDWNSYLITAWILFCILAHAYVITPTIVANDWMNRSAGICVKRSCTKLSSRRALVNTILALNPDTFPIDATTKLENTESFRPGSVRWIDRIIEKGQSRWLWDSASCKAMREVAQKTKEAKDSKNIENDFHAAVRQFQKDEELSDNWNIEFPNRKENYWKKFIIEGLYMAGKIRREADLPGRRTETAVDPY